MCLHVLSTLTQLFLHLVCLFPWRWTGQASQGCVSGAPEPWNLSCLLSLLAFVPIESLDLSNTFNSASFKIDQKENICLCFPYVVTLILKKQTRMTWKATHHRVEGTGVYTLALISLNLGSYPHLFSSHFLIFTREKCSLYCSCLLWELNEIQSSKLLLSLAAISQ